jgi:putative ABC transport system permease protein
MERLFAIPIDIVMIAFLAIFGLGIVILIISALRNRIMFKVATRNIPRRPIQTALILLGLLLAAAIFSASFSTGDTLRHSIRKLGVKDLGEVDIQVVGEGVEVGVPMFGRYGAEEVSTITSYFEEAYFDQVRQVLEDEPEVEGVAPAIIETVPVEAPDTNLNEPAVSLLGLDQRYMESFDPLVGTQGDELSLENLAADEVYVSTKVAEELEVDVEDEINIHLGVEPIPLAIKGMYEEGGSPSGDLSMVMPLSQLQSLVNEEGRITTILITNQGDTVGGAAHTDTVLAALEPSLEGTGLKAVPVKQDVLDDADDFGSVFSDLFLMFGSFSIIAGILLIFLIFVMLAAARRSELGTCRAVGTQRGQIVRLFTYEGVLYALVASVLGGVLGLVFSWSMTKIMGGMFGEVVDFEYAYHFKSSSLILAYTMGVVLTLGVVILSARRVSRLNIVRAIRDIPEPDQGVRRWGIKGLVATLLLPPLGLLLMWVGIHGEQAGPYMLGAGSVIIGLSLLAGRFLLPERAAYTLAGAGLLIFFLMPIEWHPYSDRMSYGMEPFIINGVMLVTGAVLVIMYNSSLLLRAIMAIYGRLRVLAPVLKMAISYPMAHRFRTGIALAMFSMVVFTLVFISTLSASQGELFKDTDRVSGGFHLRSTVTNPIIDAQGDPNIETALEEAYSEDPENVNPANFEAIASFSNALVSMRQAGKDQEWLEFQVKGVDSNYTNNVPYNFDMMPEGYDSPEQLWQALTDDPSLAVVSAYMVPGRNNVPIPGEPPMLLSQADFFIEDEVLPEVYIEAQEPATGEVHQLRVIGVVDIMAGPYVGEVLTSQDNVNTILGQNLPPTSHMFKASPDTVQDVPELGKSLERQFKDYGMDNTVMVEEIDDFNKIERMVFDLFEGFLALGLIIGIAALGVIAARSVVERRQQIGVLRAVGFQRRMVQFSFLMESSLIVLLAIGLGVGLGIALSYKSIPHIAIDGLECVIPWTDIVVIIIITYVASLITTYLPARQAAAVHPAEALRYE